MRKAALAILAATLFASAAPLAAFTLIERGSSFETHVTLQQAALADGSARLAPGAYKVSFVAMGDGSVHASFFDKTGRKAGEAHGIIVVVRQGASAPGEAPGPANSQQKIQSAGPNAAAALNFTKLGFSDASRSSFRADGQKLNLEVLSQDGSHSVLIGLLLPAVQRTK